MFCFLKSWHRHDASYGLLLFSQLFFDPSPVNDTNQRGVVGFAASLS